MSVFMNLLCCHRNYHFKLICGSFDKNVQCALADLKIPTLQPIFLMFQTNQDVTSLKIVKILYLYINN